MEKTDIARNVRVSGAAQLVGKGTINRFPLKLDINGFLGCGSLHPFGRMCFGLRYFLDRFSTLK